MSKKKIIKSLFSTVRREIERSYADTPGQRSTATVTGRRTKGHGGARRARLNIFRATKKKKNTRVTTYYSSFRVCDPASRRRIKRKKPTRIRRRAIVRDVLWKPFGRADARTTRSDSVTDNVTIRF